MAIKDSISRIAKTVTEGASSVASNVAKKSEELVELSKLTASATTEEGKLKTIYSEIGKLVYEGYKNGNEFQQEIAEKCAEARCIENNISTIKEKILELKNVRVCSSCGSNLAPEAAFCPKCGTKQEVSEWSKNVSEEAEKETNMDNDTADCGCNEEEN